jgi:hypothetical protein
MQSCGATKEYFPSPEGSSSSIVLLDCGKPLMTRVAAMAAAPSKPSLPFEILCVDNGSCCFSYFH